MKVSTKNGIIATAFILIATLTVYLIMCQLKKENFGSEDLTEKYKSLDVKVFYSPECSFCIKYKKLLDDYNLTDYTTFVDVTKARGKSEFESHGEPGVPVTYSEKTENKLAGLPKNIETMMEKLYD